MFMIGCPVVVSFYILRAFGIIIISPLPHIVGHILEQDSATCKRKGIRDQNNITSFCHFICPCKVAIILLLVFFHQRMLIIRSAGNFPAAEIFVCAMVMKGKNALEFTLCI